MTASSEERRVALVVGNGAYGNTTWLQNPPNDAAAMCEALARLDFEVLDGRDLKFADFAGRIRDFGRALREAHVALFFYAGHGLQVKGENYVVPVDAVLEHEVDVQLELIAVQTILAQMEVGNRTSLVILDACRNNPLARNLARAMGATRSAAIGDGLGRLESGIGTYIAFATSPNKVALDGDNARNSPFTAALLRHIHTPGLNITEVMMRVRQDVIEATKTMHHGPQVPWDHSSLIAPFYFKRRPETTVLTPPPVTDREARETEERRRREKDILEAQYAAMGFVKIEVRDESGAVEARWIATGPGQRFKDLAEGPEMVIVPAGEFMMGSPEEEIAALTKDYGDYFKNESSRHRVIIPKPFAIGRCAVTRGQFGAFVNATGHKTDGGGHVLIGSEWKLDPTVSWRDPGFQQDDQHPVVCVSWSDAAAYAAWMSKQSGTDYRLPSEAEWEYTARAGIQTPFWRGSSISIRHANYNGNYTYGGGAKGPFRGKTSPVKSFERNPWGLYQVHGNVWEWVEDGWHDSYVDKPESIKANGGVWEVAGAGSRVVRGGSWTAQPFRLRSASRYGVMPDKRYYNFGFRVVRTIMS